MRLLSWLLMIATLHLTVQAAWSSEDLEIFKLQNDLVKETEDPDMTFYKYLSLPKKQDSSYDEITSAYKKLSRKYHPDKVRRKNGVSNKKFARQKKRAEERFQRLSLIGTILRSDRKERYDYYLKTGFPKYTGSQFTFGKFRPSFLLASSVAFIIVSIVHYLALTLNSKQQRKRVEALIETLKRKAYGPTGLAGTDLSNRKVYHLDKQFLVKFDGSVWLVDRDLIEGEDFETDEQGNVLYRPPQEDSGPRNRKERRAQKADTSSPEVLLPVTPDEVPVVQLKDTLFVRLPVSLWNLSAGKIFPVLHYSLKPNQESAKPQASEEAEKSLPKQSKKKIPPSIQRRLQKAQSSK